MKINKVLSINKELRSPKRSIDDARLRYLVGKYTQASNPKVTVEYYVTLLYEFSKTKAFLQGKRKPSDK